MADSIHIEPLQALNAFRANRLEALPTAETMVPLADAWARYARGHEGSAEHRRALGTALARLTRVGADKATVADLPRLLRALRDLMRDEGKASAFNHTRVYAQGFLRAVLQKRHHPLWLEVSDIPPLEARSHRRRRPQSVAALARLADALDAARPGAGLGHIAWAMATTGMGPREFWGRWEVRADRVHVYGTKRKQRDRDVPLVRPGALQAPRVKRSFFRDVLTEVGGPDGPRPYDFRRTFAHWMERAGGIDRTRRRLYMGHGSADVTDLYEWHSVGAFLLEDALRLQRYVGQELRAAQAGPRLVRGRGE